MHLASSYGSLAFVKLLFIFGGDINAVNDNRQTPLGLAIAKKRDGVIAFLKEKNANLKWND